MSFQKNQNYSDTAAPELNLQSLNWQGDGCRLIWFQHGLLPYGAFIAYQTTTLVRLIGRGRNAHSL